MTTKPAKPVTVNHTAIRQLRASDIDSNEGTSLRQQLACLESFLANPLTPDNCRPFLQREVDDLHQQLRKQCDTWGKVPVAGENIFGVGIGVCD